MKRVDPHWLDDLSWSMDEWYWRCSCGADGAERRQDLAGEAFRRHYAEASEVAA